METEERAEDFAQLIARLKVEYDVTESEIARRIGVHVSTVNNWAHRKRGGTRGPSKETLRKLAAEFPKLTEGEIFAAVGRKTPGPLAPDAKQRLLALFEELTEEQQRMKEIEIRAIVEDNRSSS